jgi:hypothetical protein
MAVIVSDTTPLNYLVLIEAVEILPRLYGRVLIPPAVREELNQPNTPEQVRAWLARPPRWLELVNPTRALDPALSHLDLGEVQAIALALERRADLLLLDERDGTFAFGCSMRSRSPTDGWLDWSRSWAPPTLALGLAGDSAVRDPVRFPATMAVKDLRSNCLSLSPLSVRF